jgi:hypothetical protein
MTSNSEVIHLDEKRPTRAVEELHDVAATRTGRRLLAHVDWSRIGDNSPGIHFLPNSGKRLTSQIVYFVTIPALEVDNLQLCR